MALESGGVWWACTDLNRGPKDYESVSTESAQPVTRCQYASAMCQIAAVVPNIPYVCKGRIPASRPT